MPAHVWQLHIRPGKVQDFQNILSSVIELAREQDGYRGIVALASGKSESPDVTLVALWDSLEAIAPAKTIYFSRRQFRDFSHTSADLRAVCSGWPELPEVASDGNTGIAEYAMGLALRAIDSAYRGAA